MLSHYDADGITSAKIIQRGLGDVDLKFQLWHSFGVQKVDIPFLSKYQTVYVTDLGTTKETLENLKKVASNGTVVFLIDHHPPDPEYQSYQNPTLNILNDQKNCGAGLTYNFVREVTGKDDPYLKALATIGIYSDVAADTEGGSDTLEGFVSEGQSELQWKTVRWDGKVERRYELAHTIGLALNTCRRVAYDKGAYIASGFLDEQPTYDDLFETGLTLFDIPTHQLADKPYTAIVKGWAGAWEDHRNDALSLDVCHTYEVSGLTVSFTDHPWDVAPYVAGVKGRSGPCIAINYGVPSEDYASLSGRAPPKSVDLNLLMTAITEVTSGMISGGGHPQAVGGLVRRELSLKDILKVFDATTRAINR